MFKATQKFIENYFKQKSIDVSWPWFHYDYTRDWNLYTLNTDISYKDGNEKRNPDVYSEVYDQNGLFELMYLKIGNDVFLDKRNDIPDPRNNNQLSGSVINESGAVPTATIKATVAPTVIIETGNSSTEITELSKRVSIISDGVVNVRKDSNADSEKVGMAQPNSDYDCLDIAENGWYKIRLEDGTVGWISGKLARLIDSTVQFTSVATRVPDETIKLTAKQLIRY